MRKRRKFLKSTNHKKILLTHIYQPRSPEFDPQPSNSSRKTSLLTGRTLEQGSSWDTRLLMGLSIKKERKKMPLKNKQ